MISKKLDDLAPECRGIFFIFLARCAENRHPLVTDEVLRDLAQEKVYVASGKSATLHSKHLPQEPSKLSHALDFYLIKTMVNGKVTEIFNKEEDAWRYEPVGLIAESLGLRWGGRWKDPHDPYHIEWNERVEPKVLEENNG